MMMSVLDAIKSRRSIREFEERELPEDAVDALIEAVRWAPSAGNLQSRKFYFVFSRDLKKKIARAALGQGFLARAPLTVIACADNRISSRYGERGVHLYSIQDVAASVMSMMLAAHELGLGSVWVGAFNESEMSEILGLPGNLRPIALIPIGYPAETPSAPRRVKKDDAVTMMR